jgi:heterogeneous nuclear ribonucleoprotein A1/A3
MDLSKKRKTDEIGGQFTTDSVSAPPVINLTPEDARKIIEPFTKDQLLEILQKSVVRDPIVLDVVRSIADSDVTQRKLFVRGLGWDTTTDKLRSTFSGFGEVAEAIVITEKGTGKSKGYGFVTFKHIDGAVIALRQPNKKIDGRMTVTQLAASGNTGNPGGSGGIGDVTGRKIYVGNIPFEISSDRLLNHFSAYGEIEEGPLGYAKQAGKTKGFAFFVYKSEEGARASIIDPSKNIDGHQVVCKMAIDGKKGKPGGDVNGDNRLGGQGLPPVAMNSSYGIPGGPQSYGGFSGVPPPLSSGIPSSVGVGYGNQGPPGFGGGGGGFGGGGFGGSGGGGGFSGGPYGSQYGGGYGNGEFGGPNSRPGPGPMGPGSFPDPSQMHHQPPSGPRVPPPVGMYNTMPPYY